MHTNGPDSSLKLYINTPDEIAINESFVKPEDCSLDATMPTSNVRFGMGTMYFEFESTTQHQSEFLQAKVDNLMIFDFSLASSECGLDKEEYFSPPVPTLGNPDPTSDWMDTMDCNDSNSSMDGFHFYSMDPQYDEMNPGQINSDFIQDVSELESLVPGSPSQKFSNTAGNLQQ